VPSDHLEVIRVRNLRKTGYAIIPKIAMNRTAAKAHPTSAERAA